MRRRLWRPLLDINVENESVMYFFENSHSTCGHLMDLTRSQSDAYGVSHSNSKHQADV